MESQTRHSFGEVIAERPLRAVVQVRSLRFYRQLLRGSIGLCESYMDGLWECEDLVALTRIAALERRRAGPAAARAGAGADPRAALGALAGAQHPRALAQADRRPLRPRQRAVRAVPRPHDDVLLRGLRAARGDLEEASLAKLERVCAKLELRPEDHLLEIGTGWGGLAVYAAGRYGCRVTTTTISREQHAYACERVREAGLQDRVTVLLQDYRELTGSYDKLVSIEMIEAVGWQYFPTYFRRCSELLADDGAMLLQAITIEDRAYHVEKAGKSFINTYIFPGGCLPSMEIISRSLARMTDLRQVHLEDITAHYATTLRALARALPRRRRAPVRARLRRALPPAVGAVPVLLRGRLSRAAHPGRAAAAGQARLPCRAHAGSVHCAA